MTAPGTVTDIGTEPIADGVVVRPRGRFDREQAPAFRAVLAELQRGWPARLVVDLSEVPEMDGAMVAVLVEAVRVARRDGGLVILCGLTERVSAFFEIVRLDGSVFTITDTVDRAMAVPNRRKFARFPAPGVRCDRGAVLDLSAGGIRLRSRRRLRGRLQLNLGDGSTDVRVDAEVVRSRRVGLRRCEAGLQFVDLGADAARKLGAILAMLRAVIQGDAATATT